MTYKKKLIEVALPLEAINRASAHEKQPGIGAHPRGLHLWWARRPLAAARAVIFAQLVDDPSARPDLFPTEEIQDKERQRLFRIIEELVKWENSTNNDVLEQARSEIWKSWSYACADNSDHPNVKELFDSNILPSFHDPFAGGGALPLEALRLGLKSFASDLNPVAVLINKAMIEIPPRFANMMPVNPSVKSSLDLAGREWKGAQGLANDVKYYGRWMHEEAVRRIGFIYPPVSVTSSMAIEQPDLKPYVGNEMPVLAWLWARTVVCSNPACNKETPLLSSCTLSGKKGRERYLHPVVDSGRLSFKVSDSPPKGRADAKKGYKRGMSGIFECAFCGTVTTRDYVAEQAMKRGLGKIQTAVVAEGRRSRVYLPPEMSLVPENLPVIDSEGLDVDLSPNPRDVWCRNFGLLQPKDLFTPRQLVSTAIFSDLVTEARELIERDALASGLLADEIRLRDGGKGATAYADAVAVYLAFAVDRLADYNSSIATWKASGEQVMQTYKRQALPMTWDFPESNVFGSSAICWINAVKYTADNLESTGAISELPGFATQSDAGTQTISKDKVISTDPPYYDNIGYADLSDFFYVWLRRSLRTVFPDLFSTMTVPKAEELVATSYRHGSRDAAESFFLGGMTKAMQRLAEQSHPSFPVTIYYAFKQSESEDESGVTRTGWETFLEAVIRAGFEVSGTWPIRTELTNKVTGLNANMLASSIVLVCRPRRASSKNATLREFATALKSELPLALANLQAGNIAPVDLAQASIGPGMAVFTRFAKVLDSGGNALSVGHALALINQTLDESIAQQEGDFDADSRWALTWVDQVGFSEGDFGLASTLAQAKNTGMDGLVEAGIIVSGKGKVRLMKPSELAPHWNPISDGRLTAWETVHQLIRALELDGESAAAKLVSMLGAKAETARELCYRLFTLCERNKRAAEAMSYNGLVQSWPEIIRLANEKPSVSKVGTADMFKQE